MNLHSTRTELDLLRERVDRLERTLVIHDSLRQAKSDLVDSHHAGVVDTKAQLIAVRDFLYGLSISEFIPPAIRDDIRQEAAKIVV